MVLRWVWLWLLLTGLAFAQSNTIPNLPNIQTGVSAVAVPTTCIDGQLLSLVPPAASPGLQYCHPTNTWTAVGGGGGGNVSTTQTNVYGAFLQDFSAATIELPESAGCTTNVDSTVCLDSTTGIMHIWGPGAADSFNVVTSGTDTTTTHVLHATATAGLYTSSAIAVGDVPTLNQNTTGSAAKWTTARNLAGNSVDGSANVPFANAFIVQGTTDAGLSGAQFLGALGTGIVKNTTTTGVLSIATGADLPSSGIPNVVYNNAANTATSAMTLDMSAATGAAAFKVPVQAGATAGANGVLNFDSTNSNYHVRGSAADAMLCPFASAPSNGNVLSFTGSLGTMLCGDAGFTAANVVLKNVSNTAAGGMTLNMSGSTPGNAFRVPVQTGAVATSTGSVIYDSTNGFMHLATSGVDATAVTSPAAISATSQTAAIGVTTLCTALQCPKVGGQWIVNFNLWGSGTACSSVTAGKVQFLLTWTDENAVTHSAVALQMTAQTGAATTATQDNMPFQTALANEGGGGSFTFSTNGTIIQYSTAYTACTTGTGQYGLRATVSRLQ